MTTGDAAVRAEFLAVHEAFEAAWNRALQSGEVDEVAAYGVPGAPVYFAGPGAGDLQRVPPEEVRAGARESVRALLGGRQTCRNRVVKVRGLGEVVVFYEKAIEIGGRTVAPMCLEVWRKDPAGAWKIVREVVEA